MGRRRPSGAGGRHPAARCDRRCTRGPNARGESRDRAQRSGSRRPACRDRRSPCAVPSKPRLHEPIHARQRWPRDRLTRRGSAEPGVCRAERDGGHVVHADPESDHQVPATHGAGHAIHDDAGALRRAQRARAGGKPRAASQRNGEPRGAARAARARREAGLLRAGRRARWRRDPGPCARACAEQPAHESEPVHER